MSPDPTLKAVVAARRSVLQAQDRLDAAVAAARIAGASWAAIGEATGMTRQSAHERWGHVGCKGQVQADCECPAWGSEGCLCVRGRLAADAWCEAVARPQRPPKDRPRGS